MLTIIQFEYMLEVNVNDAIRVNMCLLTVDNDKTYAGKNYRLLISSVLTILRR